MHADPSAYLPFQLDQLRLALPAALVERVEPMARLRELPGAPEVVLGLLDVHGEFLPVLDARARFGLPRRPYRVEDVLILLRLGPGGRRAALWCDGVEPVLTGEPLGRRGHEDRERDGNGEEPTHAGCELDSVWPGLGHLRGIARLGGEVALIHDPAAFFLPEEEQRLSDALEAAKPAAPAVARERG